MTEYEYTTELEVSGNQLPLLKSLLNQIELKPSIGRVRIEIESNKPFLKSESETVESENVESDTDETEYVCEGCGRVCGSPGGLGAHRKACDNVDFDKSDESDESGPATATAHVTDTLTAAADGGVKTAPQSSDGALDGPTEEPESPETLADPSTGQPARDYLESELIDEVQTEGATDPDEFRNIITATLNPDTNKWYVLGLLHQTQGALTLSQITAMLEGTDWEVPYKSISACLSKAKGNGWVHRNEDPNRRKHTYQLTQLGRDYMDAQVAQTPGYALKEAARVTGNDDQ